MGRRIVLLSLACALIACSGDEPAVTVTELLGDGEDREGFAQAERGRSIDLPSDHGPHNSFRSEWWYLTVALQDAAGNDYGVQFTVFRQALSPPEAAADAVDRCLWCADQAWLGHLALTDVERVKHWHAERLSRGVDALAGAAASPFAVWIEDWRMDSVGPSFTPLKVTASGEAFEVDLTLEGGALLLQGDGGFSAKGPGQASHYFSMPRLRASGRVSAEGQSVAVSGLGWLDREWSTSVLSSGQRGWDWLSLQLDDGRDIMAFRLRRDSGQADPFDQAVVRSRDGIERHLGAGEFSLTPVRFWADELGVEWPTAFELTLVGEPETLLVEAALDDQLMRTLVRYWEGLVVARDSSGRRIGSGYLELTGYGDDDDAAARGAGPRN